jgi:hypothetical protein
MLTDPLDETRVLRMNQMCGFHSDWVEVSPLNSWFLRVSSFWVRGFVGSWVRWLSSFR